MFRISHCVPFRISSPAPQGLGLEWLLRSTRLMRTFEARRDDQSARRVEAHMVRSRDPTSDRLMTVGGCEPRTKFAQSL